jgi:hypothetical protein
MQALRLVAAITVLISAGYGAEYFPLRPGNQWRYAAGTGETFTVTVGTQYYINQTIYHKLTGYSNQTLLVRLNDAKELVVLNEETDQEQTLTSFVVTRLGWWEAPFRQCDQEGQTQSRNGQHDGPAGPFADVLEIQYRVFGCADTGVSSEQYAENIGMVRRVVNTFAGPRTFNLVYARVGKAEISASPRGVFSIAPQSNAQGGVSALIRVRVDGEQDLKLAFSTGQEYEVTVEDDAGNVVWRWSDGQVFAQGYHERLLNHDWGVAVAIPDWVLASNTGKYTVQGWLTAAGTRFSATVPLPAK